MADEFKTVFDLQRNDPIVDSNGVMTLVFAQKITDLVDNTTTTPEAIDENAAAISVNSGNISTNATNITVVTNNFNTHDASDSEHDVTGNNVGTGDFATTSVGGVVRLAALVTDAAVTTATITTADIGTAGATYSQAYAQEQTDLINEEKAKINTLITDVTSAVTQLNAFLAANKTALQMSTV